MSNPDDNLPPQTNKFFDIIPANKRSSASPTSRPIITDNSPAQTDSMINADQQPDLPEVVPGEQSTAESALPEPVETTTEEPGEAVNSADNKPVSEVDDVPVEEADGKSLLPEDSVSSNQTDIQPADETNDFPVVQTDIETSEEGNSTAVEKDTESTITTDQPAADELLLPAEATPDEVATTEAVVIHSNGVTSKSFRIRSWLIVLLFVIIIIIIGLILYLFVFKSTATTTPNTQFFGSL